MDEEMFEEPVLFDKKEIARCAQYLGIESSEPAQADIAFDFGGPFDRSAQVAADLYRRGVVRYVLLGGGYNRATRAAEVEAHKALLLAEGVPAGNIITENGAINTPAQAASSLAKVREKLGGNALRSVIVIAEWYYIRRAVMALKQNWPHGIRYYTVTHEPEAVPRLDWHLHQTLTKRVLKELDVIPEYLEIGRLAEIELEDGAWT